MPSGAAILRRARRDERTAIGRLLFDAYGEFEAFLTRANWVQMMTNLEGVVMKAGDDNLLVAELDGRLAGTVTYYSPGPKDYTRVPPEWAVIRALAVHPDCRRSGVARVLTEECLRRRSHPGDRGWEPRSVTANLTRVSADYRSPACLARSASST